MWITELAWWWQKPNLSAFKREWGQILWLVNYYSEREKMKGKKLEIVAHPRRFMTGGKMNSMIVVPPSE